MKCPCPIHQTHVCHIVEATPLRHGTGKEICALHDFVVQHLRALKSLGHKPSQASLLEMKLDSTTMFEWQRRSQDHADVLDYQELLYFLNLRTQAADASTDKKRASKPVNSMVINATPSDSCISCGTEKHQLSACTKFWSLSHSEKMELLRSKKYCLNCLCPGHFIKKYKSLNHCKHCQWPRHTVLFQEKEDTAATPDTPATTPPSSESPLLRRTKSVHSLYHKSMVTSLCA